jgi:phosphotransferase system  glucose/maltose/N-acetylglucosamine-specific IIC component
LLFLLFPFSVVAGWTNENSGAAVLFMLIGYFIIKKTQKERLVLFESLGSAGFLIGYLILILAPGNYVRLEAESRQNTLFIVEFVMRFIKITVLVLQHNSFVIGLCVFMAWHTVRCKKKNWEIRESLRTDVKKSLFISRGIPIFYGIGILAAAYSLAVTPAISGRSFLIAIVFLSILFFRLLKSVKIELHLLIQNNKSFIIVILLAAFFFSSVLPASRNIMSVYLRMKQRTEYIYRKKAEGVLDITVKSPIPVHNKHVSIAGLDDIGTANTDMARYYGINSLTGALYGTDW